MKLKTRPNVRISETEIARICTECPLPAKACETITCKRYSEEYRKLRRKVNV
jgi:tRNA(Ile)-lysidine synthase TilS/MesJ